MGRLYMPAHVTMVPQYQPVCLRVQHHQPQQRHQQPLFKRMLSSLMEDLVTADRKHRPGVSEPLKEHNEECLLHPTFGNQLGGQLWCTDQHSCPLLRSRGYCCQATNKHPWIYALNIHGYEPDDINVKIDGDKVIVHAKHEVKNGEEYNLSETRRTVNIPKGIDSQKMSCFLSRDGKFIMKAPWASNDILESSTRNLGQNTNTSSSATTETETKPDEQKDDNLGRKQHSDQQQTVDTRQSPELTDLNKSAGNAEDGILNDESSTATSSPEECAEKMTSADPDETPGITNYIVEMPTVSGVVKSHPESPVSFEEFVVLDNSVDDVENGEQNEDIMEQSKNGNVSVNTDKNVEPLADSRQFVNIDGKKHFIVKVNLKSFKPENVSIRCKDNTLQIDAAQETTSDGMIMSQQIHQQYVLPKEGCYDSVKAFMNEEGLVRVSVPTEDENGPDRLSEASIAKVM